MNDFRVILEQKEVCGIIRYYPLNRFAKFLCEMADRKTFSEDHLDIFEEYEIEVIFE